MIIVPGGLLMLLIVGAVAGWLAGHAVSGGGYGIVGDIVIGVIGAFIGGWLFSKLAPNSSVGLLGSVVVATIGAVILVALLRTLTRRRRFGFF